MWEAEDMENNKGGLGGGRECGAVAFGIFC